MISEDNLIVKNKDYSAMNYTRFLYGKYSINAN